MNQKPLPDKTEVLIVGAGPAGSTVAYQLAREGVDALLLDKARFPRGKTCAGGLNVRTAALLPFDLKSVTERVITGISFTRHLGEPVLRRHSEPLMLTVQRDRFDHFLVEQARQAGIEFFDETQFLSLRQENDGVRVETTSGPCRAKFVLGADGASSPVARGLGLMPEAPHILAVHSEVPSSLFPWPEPDIIHIDWGSLKRSYAYLFPKKGSLSVGAGGFGVSAPKIKNYQRAFLATRWRKEETFPFSTAGFILPVRRKREAIQNGRCLLLGDAAGLVDPFTAEGIYFAIRSAQLAAPLLVEAIRGKSNTLQSYQETIDRELMPELECSRLFREFFNLRPSFFHRKIVTDDRWWNALVKVLRGEKTFLDVQKKLGPLRGVLVRMAR